MIKEKKTQLLFCLILLGWFIAFWVTQPGLWTVDELVQISDIIAKTRGDGLLIENGFSLFQSHDLRLSTLLRVTDQGLVSQYPAGFAYLAWPFWAIGGVKAVIFINSLASLVSLYFTLLIAREVSDERTARWAVALLAGASFLLDYAIAVWPHAISVALTLSAVYLFLRHVRNNQFWFPLLCGILLGLAATIRLDAVFVIPGLVFWFVLFDVKPIKNLMALGFGLLPGILFNASVNLIKFGVFNPFTYGYATSSGGTGKGIYALLLLCLLATLGAAIAVRNIPRLRRADALIALSILVVLVGLSIPELRALMQRFVNGVHHLIFNMADHPEAGVRNGVEPITSNTTSFWGIYKQALGQSMPWLGILPLAFGAARHRHRGQILVLVFVLTAVIPYLLQDWHGGKSNNQRYLLVTVPILCIFGAMAMLELKRRVHLPKVMRGLLVIATFAGLFVFIAMHGPQATSWILQPISKWVFAGMLIISLICSLVRTQFLAGMTRCLFIVAVGFSIFSSVLVHTSTNIAVRNQRAAIAENLPSLPQNTILLGYATTFYNALERDDVLLSFPFPGKQPDSAFLRKALSEGWTIATASERFRGALQTDFPTVVTYTPNVASDDWPVTYSRYPKDK